MSKTSYNSMGFNTIQKVIANLDKCSRHGDSNVVNSPWGKFRMYAVGVSFWGHHIRWYSISGSKVFHNGGSYRIGTLKRMLKSLSLSK